MKPKKRKEESGKSNKVENDFATSAIWSGVQYRSNLQFAVGFNRKMAEHMKVCANVPGPTIEVNGKNWMVSGPARVVSELVKIPRKRRRLRLYSVEIPLVAFGLNHKS